MFTDRWYAPGQITFTIGQIKFLLRHWFTIRAGGWPPEPVETGYFDLPFTRKSKGRKWAKWEKPAEIWAELDQRMILAGEDGELLRDIYVKGWSYEQAMMAHRCGRKQLWQHINAALEKIQGKERSAELCGRIKEQEA